MMQFKKNQKEPRMEFSGGFLTEQMTKTSILSIKKKVSSRQPSFKAKTKCLLSLLFPVLSSTLILSSFVLPPSLPQKTNLVPTLTLFSLIPQWPTPFFCFWWPFIVQGLGEAFTSFPLGVEVAGRIDCQLERWNVAGDGLEGATSGLWSKLVT